MHRVLLITRALRSRFGSAVRLRVGALLLLIALLPAAGASAQAVPPTVPAPASAATAAPAGTDDMMMKMLSESQDRMAGFRGKLAQRLRATPDIPSAIVTTLTAQSPTGNPGHFLRVIGLIVALLTVGHAVQHVFYERPVARRLLPRRAAPKQNGSELAARFPGLVARVLMTAVGMILASLIAFGLATALIPDPTPMTEKTVILTGVGYLLVWAIGLFWRLVLSPAAVLDGELARAVRRLRRDLIASGAVGVALMIGSVWLEALGMPADPHAMLVALFGLLTVLTTIGALHVHRPTVDRIVLFGRGAGPVAPLVRLGLRLWFPVVVAYFACAWAALVNRLILGWPTELPLLLGAYAVAGAILAVYATVTYATDRMFHQRLPPWRSVGQPADEDRDGPPDDAHPPLPRQLPRSTATRHWPGGWLASWPPPPG